MLGHVTEMRIVPFLAPLFFLAACHVSMPQGQVPPPPDDPVQISAAAQRLRSSVKHLSEKIGPRNRYNPGSLTATEEYIHQAFMDMGYDPSNLHFSFAEPGADPDLRPSDAVNFLVELKGSSLPGEIVIVGAHYDTVYLSPGADDNASGLALLLELAKSLRSLEPNRTLRFVAFANEEQPYFMTMAMGSMVYAKSCRDKGENITAMLALDGLGYYTGEQGSQSFMHTPLSLFYPGKGNFAAFLGDLDSRELLFQAVRLFREGTAFPAEGLATVSWFPRLGNSDHGSFWAHGYPGIMVTDTLALRNPHYHEKSDAWQTLDFEALARVAKGLENVIKGLAGTNAGRKPAISAAAGTR